MRFRARGWHADDDRIPKRKGSSKRPLEDLSRPGVWNVTPGMDYDGWVESDRDYTAGLRLERTLAYLRSIPDPLERIHACESAAEQARAIQGRIAEVRRQAVYEATLRPGASGASVARELRVSAKAVSAATSEYRSRDLAQLHSCIDRLLAGAASGADEVRLRSARESRDVVLVARTTLEADRHRRHSDISEDAWEEIQAAVERAEQILRAATVLTPELRSTFPLLFEQEPHVNDAPPELRYLLRVLNCLPGILVDGWEGGPTRLDTEPDEAWYVAWRIKAAEPFSSVIEAGPSREGFATTEWLAWLVRDSMRAGFELDQYITSPPPYLNQPGESLAFVVRASKIGERLYTPDEFAEWVIRTWDETGYVAIEWPNRESS
jgi:transposase-like protein